MFLSQLSLADVQATVVINIINGDGLVSEQTYPHLWKLHQNVSSLDAVKAEIARFPLKK
jgi:hypothetical protein